MARLLLSCQRSGGWWMAHSGLDLHTGSTYPPRPVLIVRIVGLGKEAVTEADAGLSGPYSRAALSMHSQAHPANEPCRSVTRSRSLHVHTHHSTISPLAQSKCADSKSDLTATVALYTVVVSIT